MCGSGATGEVAFVTSDNEKGVMNPWYWLLVSFPPELLRGLGAGLALGQVRAGWRTSVTMRENLIARVKRAPAGWAGWRAAGRVDGRPTADLRTKILDFRGFDSSRILILRAGILMSIGSFSEMLSQQILAGNLLEGDWAYHRHRRTSRAQCCSDWLFFVCLA